MSFRLIREMFARRLGASGIVTYDANPGGRVFSGADATYRDLRPGGYVDLSGALAKFTLVKEAGSIFVPPTNLNQQIIAHGVFRDGAFDVHRFYLADLANDTGYVLQVIARSGTPVKGETKLFQQVTDYAPSSAEEWDMFLTGQGDEPPLIGGKDLDWKDTKYDRVWGNDNGQGPITVPRRDLTERIDNGLGSSRTIESSAMLYCRMLGDDPEWLYICALFEESSGERWVEGYVGLTLNPGEFLAS